MQKCNVKKQKKFKIKKQDWNKALLLITLTSVQAGAANASRMFYFGQKVLECYRRRGK